MRLQGKFRLNRTTLIMFTLAAFLLGLAFARTKIYIDPIWIWLSLSFVLVTLRRNKVALTTSLIIFGLTLGWWRGGIYMHQVAKYKDLYKQQISIFGQVDSDGIYTQGSQLSFDVKNLQVVKPAYQNLPGKISVKGFGTTAVYRGDIISAEGKLYPTRGSKQASMSFAKIEVIGRSTSPIEAMRRKFQAGMYSALPEPLASFGLGLLIGQRNTLPQQVSDQLSAVGLTHIVAVSGYNLTIIMLAVAYLLRGRSKYQSTFIAALLIGLFLLFTGFSASIVRAALVCGLGLAAAYYGRKFRPILLILLAAVLTAGFYPIYIWSDIGWYLSFLAFFGVLVIAPLAIRRIYKDKKPKLLAAVIAESLAAQLMVLPLIMYIFGEVSIIALPANILIVPLVPLAMLLSFVAALGGMFMPALASWIAWPAKILLTYMLDIVNLMSRIPHALSPKALSLPKLVIIYALVVIMATILWQRTRVKNATIPETVTEER